MSAKRAGNENRRDDDDDVFPDPTKSSIREGKPLPPLFPPHPQIPPAVVIGEKESRLLSITAFLQYTTRESPFFVASTKKRNYIERYTDKYDQQPAKRSIYSYIESSITLLPEELVTGKAKRRWNAQKRALSSDQVEAAELYGESDEEEEEKNSEGEEDAEGMDSDDGSGQEDEYEFENFSDDEAGDEDDGPDEATY